MFLLLWKIPNGYPPLFIERTKSASYELHTVCSYPKEGCFTTKVELKYKSSCYNQFGFATEIPPFG
jgi:hypothetical protein